MRIEHPYEFIQGTTPLLISMPHPGLLLPQEVAELLTPDARALPDTDWHIPQLYGFARPVGASLLMARYSRFAIDLNRPEDDTPLYQTATTGLFPDTLFDGTSIFRAGAGRSAEMKATCRERIWRPYHGKLMAELNRIKGAFGHAVLLDAHSIRGVVLPAAMKLLGKWNWYMPRSLAWVPSFGHGENRTLQGGAQAMGQHIGAIAAGKRADLVALDGDHPMLANVAPAKLLGRWLFGGSESWVKHVMADGKWVVKNRHHTGEEAAQRAFTEAMNQLMAA